MAQRGSFIVVVAEVNGDASALRVGILPQRLTKAQSARGIVDGVAAEHDEDLNLIGIHGLDELAKLLVLVCRLGFYRLDEGDCRVMVAEALLMACTSA